MLKNNNNILPYQGLDPRVKLCMMFSISFISLTGQNIGLQIYPRLALMLIPAILIFILIDWKKGTLFSVIVFSGWYVEAFIHLENHIVLSMSFFLVTSLITRFIPPLLMSYYIFKTTQIEALIQGLEQLKIPRNIIIPLAVMFRFIPTILEESKNIRYAMKMRNISLKTSFKQPIRYIEYRYVPLINRIIKISNDLTVASISRGLNTNEERTSFIKLNLLFKDWLMIMLTSLLTILYYVL